MTLLRKITLALGLIMLAVMPAQAAAGKGPQLLFERIENGHAYFALKINLGKKRYTHWRAKTRKWTNPPVLDWSGSTGVDPAAIQLDWPMPTYTDDAGGFATAYKEELIVLGNVPLQQANAKLILNLDYSDCKASREDICERKSTQLTLDMPNASAVNLSAMRSKAQRRENPCSMLLFYEELTYSYDKKKITSSLTLQGSRYCAYEFVYLDFGDGTGDLETMVGVWSEDVMFRSRALRPELIGKTVTLYYHAVVPAPGQPYHRIQFFETQLPVREGITGR